MAFEQKSFGRRIPALLLLMKQRAAVASVNGPISSI
jgi:hypothetical protein